MSRRTEKTTKGLHEYLRQHMKEGMTDEEINGPQTLYHRRNRYYILRK